MWSLHSVRLIRSALDSLATGHFPPDLTLKREFMVRNNQDENRIVVTLIFRIYVW